MICGQFHCNISGCNRVFCSIDEIQYHINYTHGLCHFCNEPIRNRIMKTHIKSTHGEESNTMGSIRISLENKCEICQLYFADLRTHMSYRNHTPLSFPNGFN